MLKSSHLVLKLERDCSYISSFGSWLYIKGPWNANVFRQVAVLILSKIGLKLVPCVPLDYYI